MDPSMDTATLSHVLDPQLEDAVAAAAVPAPEVVAVAPLDELPPPPETPAPRARKPRNSNTPGSSNADARRREANRLAAERSRGRQQEKIIALELAVQALGEENLRLKTEVARLEGREGEEPAQVSLVEHPLVPPDQATVEAAAAAAVAAADTQAQQDSHSRNILAALLSGAGATGNIDDALTGGLDTDADGDAANWMRGVESLFKEAEASGRLGELAAVAAGEGSEATALQDAIAAGGSDVDHRGRQSSVPAPALSTTTSAIALAIHNETEKLLRDDIAKTKAEIARVEREMTRLRGLPVYGDATEEQPLPSTLPEGIIGADEATLRTKTEETLSEITRLQSEAEVLREVVSRMRDAHTEESDKVKVLAADLRALDMDGGERERDQVTMVLKALRAQITTLMSVPGGDFSASPLVTPFSSPATARRRRGRPPKHGGLPSVKYAYTYTSTSPNGDSPFPETPTGRPNRSTRAKSGLAHEILAAAAATTPDALMEAGPSTLVDVGVSSQAAHAHAHDDYLLSHLTEAADGPSDGPIPLDSSSFAVFLPQSPQENAHHQLDPLTGEHTQGGDEHGGSQGGGAPEQPNILSRLKRGPPGSCDICGRTQTSVWRKLSLGGEDHKVCNACGLYHAKFGIIRPPELWGDGKSVKKRKASARTSTGGFDSPNGGKRKRKPTKFDPQQHAHDLQQHPHHHHLQHDQLQPHEHDQLQPHEHDQLQPHEHDQLQHAAAAAHEHDPYDDVGMAGAGADNGSLEPGTAGADGSADGEALGVVGRAVESMFASGVSL